LAATLFGIATSFHILVGGYGFLSYLIWSLSERANFKVWFKILCYYCLGAVVGIYNAVTEIATAWAFPDVSKLIVFFRVPHHTVPAYFSHHYEYKLIILLVGFIVLYWFIRTPESPKQLLRYAAITMITFMGGLFIASFDTNGTFLKYYLFRLGDTLFPLFIALVGYFGIKRFLSKRIIRIALPVVGSFCFIMAGTNFAFDINSFRRTDASADKWAQTCMWVKEHTAKDSLFLIPPGRISFTVLTERATVATFRSFPFSRAYISEWYSRLMDLNGGVPPKQVGFAAKKELDENYYNLDELKIRKLMQKYDASYIITKSYTQKLGMT